jgi:gliding motility-associated-like protein
VSIILPKDVSSQKEAYNWYFGNRAALNFETGTPEWVENSSMVAASGSVSLSDSAGNLLFYSNGEKIWNRENNVMPNGNNLFGSSHASQPCIAVPLPEREGQYYLFYVSLWTWPHESGCHYSIVDMSLDGGRGDIIDGQKNLFLQDSDSVQNIVFAIKHASRDAYWMVTRSFKKENKYLSYLIDYTGIHPEPVISDCLSYVPFTAPSATTAKFSPDGRFLIFTQASWSITNPRNQEIYSFNNITGAITPVYMFSPNSGPNNSMGAEFSANSEYLYLSNTQTLNNPWRYRHNIMQFDMSKINNIDLFEASGQVLYTYDNDITDHNGGFDQMQTGPDGKIYIARSQADSNKYLSRINYPAQNGLSSGFELRAVEMVTGSSREGLPNFIQSYFVKFTWRGNCLNDSTRFSSWFLPEPESMQWDFGDPGSGQNNFSNLLNPAHQFSGQGTFTVTATAFYPNGRIETYVRDVIITPYPVFELGEDQSICPGAEALLSSGVMLAQCLWSTGATTPSITVSDPGEYWLRVENYNGCIFRDTVNVYMFPETLLDETNLILSPTTCGNATGAIRCLTVNGTEPITLEWKDNDDNIISNDPDLFNLPVGNYFLWATDGNGCTNQLAQYTIADAGDVLIDTVLHTNSYCGQDNGSITITAISGLSDLLEYSIDNGNTWHSNEGVFTGLVPDSYTVRVRVPDGSGCETMYEENPVEILSNGSLDVVSVNTESDHCDQGIGEITITGPGNDPSIYWYSKDNGTTWIQNNGEFTSLTEGTYNLMIRDASGCTGAYIDNPVEIDNLPGPAITSPIIITPETGSDANGTITLTASGDDLSYSLNSGPTQNNGHFNGLSEGDYTITITDLFDCTTDTLVHVDQITGSYLLAMAGNDTLCLHKIANSNIRVTSITGVINLKATLSYDGQRLLCTHFNDSLPGITATIYETLSRIVLEWNGTTPIPSTDTISLGELIFHTKETGLADVMWDLNASNTFFTDENGNAITPILIPGAVTVHDPPVLALSEPLPICQGGSTRLVPGIAGGTEPISYQWQTPQGTVINTEVEIENATPDNSGIYTLMVSDYFHCTDTVSTAVEVIPLPSANFPASNPTHDTIYYEQTFLLEATPGFASYEWNTGDTTYYITVNQEGAYSLLMETTEGCQKLESIMMINTFLPVLVPNAFTPNNDGLNDTFRPVVDYERVRMFSMVIYNRWGQLIFETANPTDGWDGKDSPAGVYGWVISYSNHTGKVFKMRGSVTLLK